jgi:hypothetical protein
MATTVAGFGLKGEVYQIEDALQSAKKNSGGVAGGRNLADKLVTDKEMAHQAYFCARAMIFFRRFGEAEAKGACSARSGRFEASVQE